MVDESVDKAIDDKKGSSWPARDLESVVHCPWCRSQRRSIAYKGLNDIVFGCAPGAWDLWRCDDCRSGFLDPRPTQNSIGRAYEVYYTHGSGSGVAGYEQRTTLLGDLRLSLVNGYRNARFGTKLQPASSLGAFIAKWRPELRDFVGDAFRQLPHPLQTESARVLDIGCGNGDFLAHAKAAGWTAVGCDPDPSAVRAASEKGVIVRQGGAEAWLDEAGSFDAVTLSHVIEHVHDPLETLKIVKKLLRSGGTFYLDVPNLDSVGHAFYGKFWLGLDAPRHLSLPSKQALTDALTEIGFRSIRYFERFGSQEAVFAQSARLEKGMERHDASSDHTLRLPEASFRNSVKQDVGKAEYLTLICES